MSNTMINLESVTTIYFVFKAIKSVIISNHFFTLFASYTPFITLIPQFLIYNPIEFQSNKIIF